MKIVRDSIKILNIKANLLVEPLEINNDNKLKFSDGSIPYSLFSLYLQEKMKERISFDKLTNSYFSNLFVSVNFKCCYKVKQDDKKLYFTDGKKIEEKTGTYKTIMKSDELRTYLYENGFDLIIEGNTEHYVYLERTAAKSRVGNAVFCNERIYKQLHDYMMLGLDFSKSGKLDIPSLEVYKSLVCSSIIDTIDIDKNRICIIEDEFLEYTDLCSVTSYSDEEGIKQEDKLFTVKNNIWDGEGLIDSSISKHNMCLLRNNFFKCCCLSTNIQEFKKDYGIEYFTDMFGNHIENPLLILTTSSLKFLKFSHLFFKNKEECWTYWKEHADEHFGIVKYNKHSGKYDGKYGTLSYQVINSLPGTYNDMLFLMGDELQYIKNLREDEAFFNLHINNNNTQNFTGSFINVMSSINEDFYKTKLYRKFKNDSIRNYINELKCSHIKIKDLDYFTIFSLPNLLIMKSAQLNYSWSLEGNIVYCPTFSQSELFAFRNPHITTSNLTIVKNYLFDDCLKYFNLNEGNICIINTKNNIMNQLGGCDFDSDQIGISSNLKLIELSKKNMQFKVPVLDIEPEKIELEYNLKNIAFCDDKIKKQKIGSIVNLAAILLSYYYDFYSKNEKDERLELLSTMTNLLSNTGMAEIDNAKKSYPEGARSQNVIDFVKRQCSDILEKDTIKVSKHKLTEKEKEKFEETGDIDILLKEKDTYIKPNFFKFSQSDYKDNYSFRSFDCCSDYIVDILDNFKTRTRRTDLIEIDEILEKNKTFEHSSRNQIQTIIDRVRSYKSEYCYIQYNKNLDTLEKMIEVEKLNKRLEESVSKIKLSSDTIYCILCRMFDSDTDKFLQNKNRSKSEENLQFLRKNKILILGILCKTHKDEYIKCFKSLETEIDHLVLNENGNIEIWGKRYKREKF